jgi:hypothetical protein
MDAIGCNGQMTLQGDQLTISRKGAGFVTAHTLNFQADNVIPVARITRVELKSPGAFRKGYLRVSIDGRDPVGGLREAVGDENAVLILPAALPDFERLRDALVAAIAQRRSPATAQVTPIAVAHEIGRLAALRDRGLLTDEELTAQKRRLLGG